MKLAIMQPYFFPYIGYFQMVGNCNLFISYDTVNYIQRGWINRNRILISSEPKYITVPVCKSKLETPINKIKISNYINWKKKFLKTIQLSYKKAPFYNSTFSLLESIVSKKDYVFISELSFESIISVSKYLELKTEFNNASNFNNELILDRDKRLEYLIKQCKASKIILPPGGKELYKNWNPKSCKVEIMASPNIVYNQFQNSFIEDLSIIDVLMYNNKKEVIKMLNSISFI